MISGYPGRPATPRGADPGGGRRCERDGPKFPRSDIMYIIGQTSPVFLIIVHPLSSRMCHLVHGARFCLRGGCRGARPGRRPRKNHRPGFDACPRARHSRAVCGTKVPNHEGSEQWVVVRARRPAGIGSSPVAVSPASSAPGSGHVSGTVSRSVQGGTFVIRVVVAAHGNLASSLVKSTAMILGSNPDVVAIDFDPEGDVHALYRSVQDATKDAAGVIFLVDLLGGSPYNAAVRWCSRHLDSDVVTGVNLPMVIDVSTLAQQETHVPRAVSAAKAAGVSSVASWRTGPASRHHTVTDDR
ncbi:PTS sugar transporter subunit IIA [Propionibacterium freudenreichii]|nr:PTS sugar transporter subunit IIA [Propionibacterium freudenreichii]MCT2986375.1 PTS sugar transporter subunit IIA [Propionibacterium freudenreichii]